MRPDYEIRSLDLEYCELRAEEDEKGPRLEGYAARWNVLSTGIRHFRERMLPGAFKRSLERPTTDIAAIWNHNTDLILGRRSAGTLELAEDDRGLRVVIRPPDTQWGRDAVTSVKRKDVVGMSFGFNVSRPEGERWVRGSNDEPVRELLDVDLMEVSPATFPIYPGTRIQARALAQACEARGLKVDPALYSTSLTEAEVPARFRAQLELLLTGGQGGAGDLGGGAARRASTARRRLDLLGLAP